MGDDWAEGHHDVCLVDGSGTRLVARRLPEELAGVGMLYEMIGEHASDPATVVVGSRLIVACGWVRWSGLAIRCMRSIPKLCPVTAWGELNQTAAMPGCWPIWYVPTGIIIVGWPVTALGRKASKCWPGHIRTLSGPGRVTPTGSATLYANIIRQRWKPSLTWRIATL